MSDTVVVRKGQDRKRQEMPEKGRWSERHTAEKVNKDLEPTFHNTSLPIAGHVGQGRLFQGSGFKAWQLSVEGLGIEMEAFPDVLPKLEIDADQCPWFVVLVAKQVVAPSMTNVLEAQERASKDRESDNGEILRERLATDAHHISGRGILIRKVTADHYIRTGAFDFSGVNEDDWVKLLGPPLTKFWLD
jgi:hypothetical protein